MKKAIIISSLIVIVALLAEAYRENLSIEWQHYQVLYKNHAIRLAKTEQEEKTAKQFKIKMRQIVLPELKRVDRCVICHVAMEDQRMKDMPNPIKLHPGDYLENHDVDKIGCTICHDGQGRAITFQNALAHGHDKYWEKPALLKPFVEANCYRCHHKPLAQTPHYNKGKETFETKGCLGCHRMNEKGGTMGPDLSNLGNASFHVKMPTSENRESLLHKFSNNTNLAYIYEAVKEPHAQPENSKMIDYHFNEEEATDLAVYLKSFLTDIISPHAVVSEKPEFPENTVARGKKIFKKYCSACHNTNGQGIDFLSFGKAGPGILGKDFLRVTDHDQVVRTIQKGRENGQMPSWGSSLEEDELEALMKYINSKRPIALEYDVIRMRKGMVEDGKEVFLENCAVCHMASKNGSLAKPINQNFYLEKVNEKEYYNEVVKGRLAKGMPSYANFSKKDLADLLALFRYWKSGNELYRGKTKLLQGDLQKGQALFEKRCFVCHGRGAKGGFAPEIGAKKFKETVDEGFVKATLATGRGTSIMLPIQHITGARTPEQAAQQIADIMAYLESLYVRK